MTSPLSLYRRLPLLSQRTRRLLVIGTFAGYPLLQIGYRLLVEPGRVSTTIWAPIAIALFAITLIGVFAVYGYGQGRMGYPKNLADERQRAMHDRALVVSYGVVTVAVGLLVGGLTGLAMNGPVVIEMGDLVPFLIGFGLYLPTLPFAALAWIEPDAPADEEA